MRESCTSGSVRGALRNERPYREYANVCKTRVKQLILKFLFKV